MRLQLNGLRVFIIALVFVFGATTGTFIFSNTSAKSETQASEKALPKDEKGQTIFPKNESGLSYGSATHATSPDNEPDLIEAWGIDGTLGYVLKSDLYGKKPKNPEEAITMMKQQQKAGDRAIPLYESDGKTVIGTFIINQGTVLQE